MCRVPIGLILLIKQLVTHPANLAGQTTFRWDGGVPAQHFINPGIDQRVSQNSAHFLYLLRILCGIYIFHYPTHLAIFI